MRENIAKNLCKVIALANQKGGVAKSFTTASLAVGLVNLGNRVCQPVLGIYGTADSGLHPEPL